MRTYADSLLEREITKLSQELVSLKTAQRYLTGAAIGYKTESLRVNSHFEYSVEDPDGNIIYLWTIYVRLRFSGDYIDKTTIPSLQLQAYDYTGKAIEPDITGSWQIGNLYWGNYGNKSVEKDNEHDFMALLYMPTYYSGSNPFYCDFWCVSNMTGRLALVERLPYD